MNIKALLVERERRAYINGDVQTAKFNADTLDYIIALEEKINAHDLAQEQLDWPALDGEQQEIGL